MQYRQGDVLVESKPIPKEATLRHDPVLARGEATGHCHTAKGDMEIYERDGVLYLRVGKAGGTVAHQEHSEIVLPRGDYEVTIQREYAPEAIRNVSD